MNKILMIGILVVASEALIGCNLLNVEGDVGSNNNVKADVKVDSGAKILSDNKIDSGANIGSNNSIKIDSNVTNIVTTVEIKKVVFGVDYDIEQPAFGEWNKMIEEENVQIPNGFFQRPRPDTNLNYPRSLPPVPDGYVFTSVARKELTWKLAGTESEKCFVIKELRATVYLIEGEWYFLAMKSSTQHGVLIKWEK